MKRYILPLLVVAAVATLAALPGEAPGCAAAPRRDEYVSVNTEMAAIIWDDATRTEHFIRKATFESTSYDFGFLVPTPSQPQLEEADGSMFDHLAKLTAPRIEHRTQEIRQEIEFGCSKHAASEAAMADKAGAQAGFAVLQQKRIGNLDAAVLGFKANAKLSPEESAAQVQNWLKENGYAVGNDLLDWIKIYAAQNWVITAFKIAGVPPAEQRDPMPKNTGKDSGVKQPRRPVALSSTTVRMSFKTERPFFPYREPASQRLAQPPQDWYGSHERLLRVFLAAKERMTGKLGDGKQHWPGETVWADAAPDETRTRLLGKSKLAAESGPGKWQITEFEDTSSPRPGTDEVYFERSPDQSAVARPPIIITKNVYVKVYPAWFGPVVVLVPFTMLVAGVLVWRWFSLRSKARGA